MRNEPRAVAQPEPSPADLLAAIDRLAEEIAAEVAELQATIATLAGAR